MLYERLGISLFCFRQDNSQGYTVFEPICTKTGIDGGAFLMSGYRKELYLPLSIDEESLLLRLMSTVCENEQHLIATIINKYAMSKQST